MNSYISNSKIYSRTKYKYHENMCKETKCCMCNNSFFLFCSEKEWAYKTFKNSGVVGDCLMFCSWTCLQNFRKKTGIEAQENLKLIKIRKQLDGLDGIQ